MAALPRDVDGSLQRGVVSVSYTNVTRPPKTCSYRACGVASTADKAALLQVEPSAGGVLSGDDAIGGVYSTATGYDSNVWLRFRVALSGSAFVACQLYSGHAKGCENLDFDFT